MRKWGEIRLLRYAAEDFSILVKIRRYRYLGPRRRGMTLH